MPTTLFLVRHGATSANLTRPYTLQGKHENNHLIEVGEKQAEAAARFLNSYPVAAGYASPLARSRKTGEIIAEKTNLSCTIVDGLVEADVGVWAGMSWEEISQGWPELSAKFHDDPEIHGYLGGENLAQVRERLLPVYDHLLLQHPGDAIVVAGHGVANRVMLAHWLGLPLSYARRLPQDNAGINIIDFHEGTAKVRTINFVGHLQEHSG